TQQGQSYAVINYALQGGGRQSQLGAINRYFLYMRIAEFSEIPLQIIPQFNSLFRTGICFCVSVTFVCS
ncbi:MAG: hypothetical protein J6J58_06805, partial [Oscillospiraceae bacterium]|nr:hypothetical protein [Oscillospiraceae bacterium]